MGWGRYYHRNMFGDFLRNHERLDYSDLRSKEPGTPIVIRYSNRMFQFGIYGENRVIFQRCFSLGEVIFFSIERCSAKEFCERGQLYEYTPQYDFCKSIAYDSARYYYENSQEKVIPACVELRSVYGDDFTLICMVGHEAFANAFHKSRMGKHFRHSFRIAGMAPAQHHLLAIEEGFVVHFSRGDSSGAPQIIIEELDHVIKRAYDRWGSPLIQIIHKHEDTASHLIARNRALLVYAGFVPFGAYDLLSNNCEHFVRWCKNGKAYSGQVMNFFMDAVSVLTSIMLRNPAPLMARLAQRKLLFR